MKKIWKLLAVFLIEVNQKMIILYRAYFLLIFLKFISIDTIYWENFKKIRIMFAVLYKEFILDDDFKDWSYISHLAYNFYSS